MGHSRPPAILNSVARAQSARRFLESGRLLAA